MQENYISKKNHDSFLIEGVGIENSDYSGNFNNFGGFDDLSAIDTTKRSQKEKLIDHEWNANQNLEHGKRKAYEAEKMSYDIMLNMDQQSNQIKAVRENLFKINYQMDENESIIDRMTKRENRNKLYIILIVICIIVAIVVHLIIFN